MRKTGLKTGGGDGLEDALKDVGLLEGLLFVAEGGMQVRIDAGDGDMIHIGIDGQNFVHLLRQEAVAAHAGIDLDMRLGDSILLRGDAVEDGGVLLARDGEHGVQREQLAHLAGIGGGPEHQNFFIREAALPQGGHVGDLGHGVARDPGIPAGGGHRDQPETVAVSLEDGVNDRRSGALFDVIQIFAQLRAFHDIGLHGSRLPSVSLFAAVFDQIEAAAQLLEYGGAVLDAPIDERIEHQIQFADEFREIAAEALLEAEQAVERIVLRHVAGDAAEIIDAAAGLDRPLDHAPLEQIVRHEVAVLVRGRAVEIPDLVAVVDGERSSDGRTLRVEGHIQPRVFTQIVKHIRKILRLAGDEAVAHAGGEHQLGEGGHHLLAADPDAHALALGKADVIAPFLMEAREKLLLGLALDVQAEHIARLDGLEILAALLAAEAEALKHFGEDGVGGGDVGGRS